MKDSVFSILKVALRHERHVVHARQRAREIAELLGFEHQEQIRFATATSELARNAFRYATGGVVEFLVLDSAPQALIVSVTDTGPGIAKIDDILNGRYVSRTGLGKGITGTRRLMDHFKLETSSRGTHVEFGKPLPVTTGAVHATRVKSIGQQLATASATDPFDELERQNKELLNTLAELREKQDLLATVNRELEATNRGVVALYAELDQHANDLRRVSDLKTSFLSNLSHEFRTPLNSMTSLCRLLLNRSDGELAPEQEKQVTYIQRSAAELTELVNDLLDLAKVEAGKIEIKPRLFEVDDLFGGLRGMLRPLMSGNSLELVFDPATGIPPLYTDEGKLSQILRNLIANALKFTPAGQVRVSAHLDDSGTIAFTVADTGIGIAPEDHARIFEEFTQIDSEIQGRVKGTGLGLPLSRRLAELLGGSIELESEPGIGSSFIVRMPAHFAEAKLPAPLPVVDSKATGASILLIEDNAETRFVQQASLKNSNYRLTFAANIAEARLAMASLTPALIVLDRLIDGRESFFYIEELRSKGYSGPVLAISVVDDTQAAIKAGATAFLAKPIASSTLLNTVRELIEGSAAKTVLLVDDDEVSRYLLGESLVKAGYRILEARNGREAIQTAGSHIPDAMVLDLVMPDLSGFDVLREIRSNPATSMIPVIVHSSKDLSAQERDLLFASGALLYPKQSLSEQDGFAGLQHVLSMAGIVR